MLKKLLPAIFIIAFVIVGFKTNAQTKINLNEFSGIQSEGEIPLDFRQDWIQSWQERIEDEELEFDNKKQKKLFQKFWASSEYEISRILRSGDVSFGDPVTQYLNEIKDKLLKNDKDLAKQIRIYLVKSPIVNAFATQQGILFINAGLVARAKTEADLAFVISHEIIHFREDHVLNAFYERDAIDRKKGEYKGLYILEQIDIKIKGRKRNEFYADQKGLELFLKSEYNVQGISNTLNLLHNNYIPWEEQKIDDDFLALENYKIPQPFFRPKLDPLDTNENYFDQTHSHPNIYKRRKILDSLIAVNGVDESKSLFVISEEKFNQVKVYCQFETLFQEIKNGYFGDALYNIDVLKKDFPDNKFLDRSFAKALYGISVFKLYDHFPAVARSYTKAEGASQQVHYLLRQMSARQFSSLSLAHLYSLSKKYPEEDLYLDMAHEITKNMLIHGKMDSKEFMASGKVSRFRKQKPDFKSEEEWIRAGQLHYKEFYKYLLCDAISDQWLTNSFEDHYPIRDSIQEEYQLKARYKKRRARKKRRNIARHGAGLDIQKLWVVNPIYYGTRDKRVSQFERTEKRRKKWLKKIRKISEAENVELDYLAYEDFDSTQVERVNHLQSVMQFIKESEPYRLRNLSLVEKERNYENDPSLENRYVAFIQILDTKNRHSLKYYHFIVMDLANGEIVYENHDRKWYFLVGLRLKWELKRDMKRISKTW